ncbi:18495_t:CDS:2 [Dentiscutata erythropus]|uniref:18495_t:CDS:1 n=1 Tax=Dentiscutata erythropus TaxID=1348616 RepID=A0A9N9FIT9_9GLOM|nr:18495_t:CDS:2 [Dentiscutata erythropus]
MCDMDNMDNEKISVIYESENISTSKKGSYEFQRILGILTGMGFSINVIIGSGIFVLPGDVWRLTKSPIVALAFWVIGGIISLLGCLIYSELGSFLPRGAGELRYLEEAYPRPHRVIAHAFSIVMIFVIRPTAIISDSYVCAQYLLYLVRGDKNSTEYLNPDGFFTNPDFFEIRFISIAILFIITLYRIIIGALQNRGENFNNGTINSYEIPVESIGSYGDAMIKVLYAYEDILINIAFIMTVNPADATSNYIGDASKVIAIYFGEDIGNIGGDIGSRIIVYSSITEFIPEIFAEWGLKYFAKWSFLFNTPTKALIAQFCYCAILILFFPTGTSFFIFFANTTSYLTAIYYGACAVGLITLRKKFRGVGFKIPFNLHVVFLIFIILVSICSFFPLPATEERPLYFLPYVVSWASIIIVGGLIYLYKNNKAKQQQLQPENQ